MGGRDGAGADPGNPVLPVFHVGLSTKNVGRVVIAIVFGTGDGVSNDVEACLSDVGDCKVGDGHGEDQAVWTLLKLPNETIARSTSIPVLSVPNTDATAKLK